MTIVDIIFFGLTYAAFHLGHHRGLVGAAFGLFGWLVAFVLAVRCTPWGTGVIDSLLNSPLQINPIIAFVILGWIFWSLVKRVSSSGLSAVENGEISVFNRLAGGGLYWVAFMLTFSIALRIGNTYKLIPPSLTERSRIYNQMLSKYPDIAMKSVTYLLPFIADGWNVLDRAISGIDTALNEVRPTPAPVAPPPPPPQPTPNTPNAPTTQPDADAPLPSVFDGDGTTNTRRYKEAQ